MTVDYLSGPYHKPTHSEYIGFYGVLLIIIASSLKKLTFPLGSNYGNKLCLYMYYRLYLTFPPIHWSLMENSLESVIGI